MADIDSIPTQQNVIDNNGKMQLQWILFMQTLLSGDQGTAFVPDVSGLTVVGNPTIAGYYYNNQGFSDFYITIVPGTSTTSTAGTTYFTLPFDVVFDAPCFAITGTNGATGAINAATDRCYTPAWSALTTPVTINGRVATQ